MIEGDVYDIGDTALIRITCVLDNGTPFVPTSTPLLKVRDPETYLWLGQTPIRVLGSGVYEYDFPCAKPGVHVYVWTVNDTNVQRRAREEGTFYVRKPTPGQDP